MAAKLIVLALLVCLCCGAEAGPQGAEEAGPWDGAPPPRVDERVALIRAPNAARSRACTDGTEFVVTFADDFEDGSLVERMDTALGRDAHHFHRDLRSAGGGAGQLKAATVCIAALEDVEPRLQALRDMPGVEAIEENFEIELFSGEGPADEGMGTEDVPPDAEEGEADAEVEPQAEDMGGLPSGVQGPGPDVDVELQAVPWHLDRVDQIRLPLDGRYNPPRTGRNVLVYVADTGVDAWHPQLRGRVARGYSAVPREKATKDYKSHGTHCAGIVAAPGYGVAKSVLVVPVKVFGRSRARSTSADIIEAINFVIARKTRHRRPTVLSMSFGSRSSGFYAGERALAKARQVGIISVVAAGNARQDACGFWPAHSRSVITVGATDRYDRLSSFSNFGRCVDLYAPGTRVLSTLPRGRVGHISGTSMACPVVSGAVAVYLEARPTADAAEVRAALLRNAVGQKNVVAARRVLLVHVHDRRAPLPHGPASKFPVQSARALRGAALRGRSWDGPRAFARAAGVVAAVAVALGLWRARAPRPPVSASEGLAPQFGALGDSEAPVAQGPGGPCGNPRGLSI